jgi:hypothetical protein
LYFARISLFILRQLACHRSHAAAIAVGSAKGVDLTCG